VTLTVQDLLEQLIKIGVPIELDNLEPETEKLLGTSIFVYNTETRDWYDLGWVGQRTPEASGVDLTQPGDIVLYVG